MESLQQHLATTLRHERSQRGWSLTQAADATGVSKAMLGQIERGESSPTIATLWKIATGFNLSFSAFISTGSSARSPSAATFAGGQPPQPGDPAAPRQPAMSTQNGRAVPPLSVDRPQRSQPATAAYQQSDRGMQAMLLFPYDPQTGCEVLAIELAAGALSESAAHETGMIEHVIVIEGELEICLDGEWQRLACGEGLRFCADRPHAYRNPGSRTVRFHDLIHYPRRESPLYPFP